MNFLSYPETQSVPGPFCPQCPSVEVAMHDIAVVGWPASYPTIVFADYSWLFAHNLENE